MKHKLIAESPKIAIGDIELIVYDFDGVITDNRVIIFGDGKEAVIVNRSDGLAMDIIKRKGIPQVIITSENNKVVVRRAEKLGIPLLSNVSDKKNCLMRYCRDNKYELKKTIYIGNDLNDLKVMKLVGMPMCPKDAPLEIKDISCTVINKKGGEGVIRELLNIIRLDK